VWIYVVGRGLKNFVVHEASGPVQSSLGLSTLHSGPIDPSKNGQSQDTTARLRRRRSQRGSLRDSPEPPHLPKFNFKPCNLPICQSPLTEILRL
jgi:hypothetical protein